MKKLIIAGMLTSLCACAATENSEPEASVGLAPERVTLGGVTNADATKKLYQS